MADTKMAAPQGPNDMNQIIRNNDQPDLESRVPGHVPGDKEAAELAQTQTVDNDPFLVTFQPNDPENPLNWNNKLKWAITAAVSGTTFLRIMVSTMMAPGINKIAADFNMSTTVSTMALSVYLLATAFGPLLIGPLCELYGRQKMFHITAIWFLVWNIVCGFANSGGLLIAARLLAGFGASGAMVLGVGVLGDIWSPEQRGRSLSLYMFVPLMGAAIGPIVAGFIVQYAPTWRWMFWASAILQAVFELSAIFLFSESYAPILLRWRAVKLREETGDARYHTALDVHESGLSAAQIVRRNLSRPLRLLAFHPIIQMQAILSGISYGLLYFALASFSSLHVAAYSESVAMSGLHYIAICIGEIAGSSICGPLMDYVYKRLTSRSGESNVPELRVPLLIPGMFLTPIGLVLYGWAAQYRLHWAVVDVGAAILTMGMQMFGIVLSAYVMDAYPEHISSAAAATQVLKSLLAFAFPLFSDSMYKALGYGWGNTMLAFLSFGIALPSTAILWYYGAKLRAQRDSSY